MSKTSLLLTSIFILSSIAVNSAENPKPQVKSGDKICFIGDSITAMGQGNPYGYVNLAVAGLKANGIDVKWQANCGGGQTSQGVIENFMPRTLTYKPDFVTIVIGTNDVGHQKGHRVTEDADRKRDPRNNKQFNANGVRKNHQRDEHGQQASVDESITLSGGVLGVHGLRIPRIIRTLVAFWEEFSAKTICCRRTTASFVDFKQPLHFCVSI
jgi:lysophospholipase L1-like esterase